LVISLAEQLSSWKAGGRRQGAEGKVERVKGKNEGKRGIFIVDTEDLMP
jgi:hypothetical protein